MQKISVFSAVLLLILSLSANAAVIQTSTGTINVSGSLIYDPQADDSDWDVALGTNDWNWLGRMTLTPSLVGVPPEFTQVATWTAELGVEFDYSIAGSTDMAPSFMFSDSGFLGTGPLGLGTMAASDVFVPTITSYNDVLIALISGFTSAPSLTDIFTTVDAMVLPDLAGMLAGAVGPTLFTDLTDIANTVFFGFDGSDVLFGSTSGDLILGTTTINSVDLEFGGFASLSASYMAVPSPAGISILSLGLLTLFLRRHKAS